MNLMRGATLRNLARLKVSPPTLKRFQSIATSQVSVKEDESLGPESKISSADLTPSATTASLRKLPPLNIKVRDVSQQVLDSVNSSDTDLLDAIAMFEEGLVYLGDIQVSEGIDRALIVRRFRPSLAEILKKAMDPNVSIGSKSIEDILQFAADHGISHPYFNLVTAKHYLESSEDKMEGYRKVLSLWVSSLSQHKQTKFISSKVLELFGVEFQPYSFANLVYFAYLETCREQGAQPDLESAKKLLQTDRLPPPFFLTTTLRDMGLLDKYRSSMQQLLRHALEIELKDMDPNGRMAHERIKNASKRNNPVALANVFGEIQAAAERSNKRVNEETINCVLRAYIDAGYEEEVFKVFQGMIKSGVTKPLVETWGNVLRAMGSPRYIERQRESKEKLLLTIDGTIETIISNGTAVTAKLLSVFVGCYANLNCFDKVEEVIKRFSVEGNGKLPLINPLKDNVIIGLLLNSTVVDAEAKLKAYTNDGSGYIPSISVMNTFLSRYAALKNYMAIEKVMLYMKDNNIREDTHTFTIAIDVFFKTHRSKGLVPNVSTILDSLRDSKTFTLNEITYTALIDGLLKDGMNLDAARDVSAVAMKLYPRSSYLLTAMIKGELEWGLIGNAASLFEQYLTKAGNEPRIWNMVIKSLLFKDEALALQYYERFKGLQNMTGGRTKPNFYTYYYLLTFFVKRGNKAKIQYFIDEISAQELSDFGSQLPLLLQSLQSEFDIPAGLLSKIKKE